MNQANMFGLNYLTDVMYWGNLGEGIGGFGETQRVSGPSGWLNKLSMGELELMDWICYGDDKSVCPWPAGIHSKHLYPCVSSGYWYSKQHNQCYLKAPKNQPKCNLLHKCELQSGEANCGAGWSDECSLTCKGQCSVSAFDASQMTDQSPDHFVCSTEGKWLNAVTEFPKRKGKITFDEGNLFRDDTPFLCDYPIY